DLTATAMLQLLFAAIVPPVRLSTAMPAVPVGTPPHMFVRAGVGEMTNPAGKLSVKPTAVSGVAFGLVSVIVSVESVFTVTLLGVKVLVAVGGATAAAASAVIPASASSRPAPTRSGPHAIGTAVVI